MTPLYPDGVYAPLPRFSKKTQTNIAPSATRNTASATCSREALVISVGWSSKGSLLLAGEDVFGQERGHEHVGDVDELADLEVDGDAAEGVGLLPCPPSLGQVVDHVEERVAGRERDVLGVVDA